MSGGKWTEGLGFGVFFSRTWGDGGQYSLGLGVLPSKIDGCCTAALRAGGPVALAELHCPLPSHLAKVQDDQYLSGLGHPT